MKKQTVKPDSVTQYVFDHAIELRNWLSSFGQGATVAVNPDNHQQMFVIPEFTASEMRDVGIDVFKMPDGVGAWSDWNDDTMIIVGPQGLIDHSPEPFNEDEQPVKQPLDLDI